MSVYNLKNSIVYTLGIMLVLLLISCKGTQQHYNTSNGIVPNKIWFESDKYAIDSIVALEKKNGTDYKILLLADIQIDRKNKKGKSHAFNLIDKLVATSRPNLIVTLGDNTQGRFSDVVAKQLCEHLSKFNIPWAVVLGNHDSEGRKQRAWFGNLYETADNSLFQYGPANIHGVGNYSINLKDENGDVIYTLIMLDSNTYRNYADGEGYDFIYPDQINWYQWQVKGVSTAQYGIYNPNKNKVVPSMCFFHIPLMEYADAAQAVKNGNIETSQVMGENKEKVASAKMNSGLFQVMKDLKSTTHVFCGHDHINSMAVNWQGINLCYGLKTGKTSYHDATIQGGTLLTIKADAKNKEKSTAKVEIKHLFITD